MTTPNKHQERKMCPVFSGCVMYFPDALQAIAKCSKAGNDQHNPGTPLHWDRAKSGDELDAMMRHAMEAGTFDDDGILHDVKVAWRACANLQKQLEKLGLAPLSEYNQESQEMKALKKALDLIDLNTGKPIDESMLEDTSSSTTYRDYCTDCLKSSAKCPRHNIYHH
jgi:hypothetical protein